MKKYIVVIAFFFIIISVEGQENPSNVQKYTPSVLLEKGTWELNSFYNLYTQTQRRDIDGNDVELADRETFLNVMYQFTYGSSTSRKLNIGLDVWVSRALYDPDRGSPFKVLLFDEGRFSRTAVTGIGPRVRYVPFNSLTGFSIQSTFLFPVASDLETPDFTGHDRFTWFTQFFYDMRLSNQWRLFLETDFLYRIDRDGSRPNFFRIPFSAFLSYFLSDQKTTFFLFTQYAPRFTNRMNSVDERFGLDGWFTQLGIGGKYQLTSRLGLEVSYANFIASRQDGGGYALNLGLRYIR
ncbi:MAG: hypothetical protein AAGF85_08440 [Bacteroidota bacterium]